MSNIIDNELRAAAKRKDLKSILVLILAGAGRDDDAKEVKDASRLTSALIDRTMCDREPTEEPDYTEIREEYAEEVEEEYAEEVEEEELTYADKDPEEEEEGLAKKLSKLQKAIASGKVKKAKKVLKDLIDMGLKGAEMDNFIAQVNELKKDK